MEEDDIVMDSEFVCLSEEDYDEMCKDISFWSALSELLSERLAEHGLLAIIEEDAVWERVREQESGITTLS